jgi:hypothetical protein
VNLINEDSVEIDVLDYRAADERASTRLWDEIWVITSIEDDGYLKTL